MIIGDVELPRGKRFAGDANTPEAPRPTEITRTAENFMINDDICNLAGTKRRRYLVFILDQLIP